MRVVGDERNSRDGTGYVNCGAERNLKMWGPMLKIIKNVKMVIAEPLTPSMRAPSDGTCLSPAHAACRSLADCDSKYGFLWWKKERFLS